MGEQPSSILDTLQENAEDARSSEVRGKWPLVAKCMPDGIRQHNAQVVRPSCTPDTSQGVVEDAGSAEVRRKRHLVATQKPAVPSRADAKEGIRHKRPCRSAAGSSSISPAAGNEGCHPVQRGLAPMPKAHFPHMLQDAALSLPLNVFSPK